MEIFLQDGVVSFARKGAFNVVERPERKNGVSHGHQVLWWADVRTTEVGCCSGSFEFAAVYGLCGNGPWWLVAFERDLLLARSCCGRRDWRKVD